MNPRRIGKALPLFVPLLAAYPVVYLATANPGQARWATVAGIALLAVLAALAVFGLIRTVARSAVGAGLATVFVVVMFFSYGQVSAWLDSLMIALRLGDNQTPNVLDAAPWARPAIAVAWGAVALVGAWFLARAPRLARPEIGRAATFAAVLLLAGSFVTTLIQGGKAHGSSAAVAATGTARTADVASTPDVYFIVLDGYAREDVLARYYGYDNSPFLDALRQHGFRIAEQSSSNYNWTFLSLASTLNLGYLQELFPKGINAHLADRSLLYESIRNSLVARFLRERGYRTVHFQSTWGATAVNPYADREVRCEFSMYANEFVRAVVEASWLGAFHSKAGVDLANCHLANFEALAGMGAEPGPKFVFAHFVLPHHPYLFDRDGNVLRNAVISNQFEFQKRLWEDRDSYRSQLEFVNRKILEAVNGILESSSQPPVIILESDHGPTLIAGMDSQETLALRFATLGAYLLPGAPEDLLPPNASAVNQFRAVLRHYFGAELAPLPTLHFMSAYDQPYAFREVPHEMLSKWWTTIGDPVQAQPIEKLAADSRREPTDASIRR